MKQLVAPAYQFVPVALEGVGTGGKSHMTTAYSTHVSK